MAQYQAQWPVSVMGEVMQVSRSGFYRMFSTKLRLMEGLKRLPS